VATVRELLTKIGFQVDDKALKDAQQATDAFVSNLKSLAVVATAGAVALAGLTARAVAHGQQAFAESAQLAITKKGYQELAYVQRLTGVSTSTLVEGLSTLNDQLRAARMGNSYASFAFARLGVSIRDANGKARATREIFEDVATQLAKLPPSYRKTALATSVFGGSASALAPVLEIGGEKLREMRNEAGQLGLVLDDTRVNSLAATSREASRFVAVLDGLAILVGSELAPAIKPVVDMLAEWAKQNREVIGSKVREWAPVVVSSVAKLAVAAAAAAAGTAELVNAMGGVENVAALVVALTGTKLILGLLAAGKAVLAFAATLQFAGISSLAAWGWFIALPLLVAAVLYDVTRYFMGAEDTITGSLKKWFESSPVFKAWFADMTHGAEELWAALIDGGSDAMLAVDTMLSNPNSKWRKFWDPIIDAGGSLMLWASEFFPALGAKIVDWIGLDSGAMGLWWRDMKSAVEWMSSGEQFAPAVAGQAGPAPTITNFSQAAAVAESARVVEQRNTTTNNVRVEGTQVTLTGTPATMAPQIERAVSDGTRDGLEAGLKRVQNTRRE
jgi:hypothetical protein